MFSDARDVLLRRLFKKLAQIWHDSQNNRRLPFIVPTHRPIVPAEFYFAEINNKPGHNGVPVAYHIRSNKSDTYSWISIRQQDKRKRGKSDQARHIKREINSSPLRAWASSPSAGYANKKKKGVPNSRTTELLQNVKYENDW